MGWNGSGGIVRTNGAYTGATLWQQSRDAGLTVDPEYFDTHDEDIADALENCLARDGQNAASGNLDLGSNRILSLGAATAVTDALRCDQLQKGSVIHGGTSSNSGDAFSITLAPAPAAYTNGMLITWVHNSDNSGASTLNVNGLGAKAIQSIGGYALTAGELKANDAYAAIYYSNIFYLLNPRKTIASTWSPTLGASGSMTFTSTTVNNATYTRTGQIIDFNVDVSGTVGGTPSVILTFSLPVTAATADNEIFVAKYTDSVDTNVVTMAYASTTSVASVSAQPAGDAFNAGACRFKVSGRYVSA